MIRPHTLSDSILRGHALCPTRLPFGYINATASACDALGAAFLGTLHGAHDLQRFTELVRNSSTESICTFIHHGLMKSFPQLGMSLREFPRLQRALGSSKPPDLEYQHDGYQLRHPASLFRTITFLHDLERWDASEISATLARAGL